MKKLLLIFITLIFSCTTRANSTAVTYKLCATPDSSEYCDLIINSYIFGLKAGLDHGLKSGIKEYTGLLEQTSGTKMPEEFMDMTLKLLPTYKLTGGSKSCYVELKTENVKKAFLNFGAEESSSQLGTALLNSFIKYTKDKCKFTNT